MPQRDELFRQFGPILLEALTRMMVDECNRLRSHVGMPPITKEMFMTEINNHLSTLEPYDWMTEEH